MKSPSSQLTVPVGLLMQFSYQTLSMQPIQLIIPLQLSSVTSYFDVYSLSIAEYGNEYVPKIHLIAEEPPCDPSTEKIQNVRLICQIIKV